MAPSDSSSAPLAFVALPRTTTEEVRARNDDLFDLILGPLLQSSGYSVIRLDEISPEAIVTGDVVRYVQQADLCVFDLTGADPNVMYECGRRHESDKPYIQLVSVDALSVPFDLADVRTLTYDLSAPRRVHDTSSRLKTRLKLIGQAIFSTSRDSPERGPTLSSIASSIEILQRQFALSSSKIGRDDLTVISNAFGTTEIRKITGLCFVIMPFTTTWSGRIHRIIREAVSQLNPPVTLRRADDLFGQDVLMDIWRTVCEAEVVIAEVTGRNPNVFYELGMAHTVGTDVILLTQEPDDIPFDLRRYRHIVYSDNEDGTAKLRTDIAAAYSARRHKRDA